MVGVECGEVGVSAWGGYACVWEGHISRVLLRLWQLLLLFMGGDVGNTLWSCMATCRLCPYVCSATACTLPLVTRVWAGTR